MEEGEVGVGPWAGPLPDDPRYDPELLATGDRRNVVDRYQHVEHHPDVASLLDFAVAEGLQVVAVDNTPGACRVETAELPRRCVLLFGQEGPGLSDAARDACDRVYSIAQYGSTRSINAGVASGIAMHAWVRAHAGPPAP